MKAGGAGMTVGLIARPAHAAELRQHLSDWWSVIEMWNPGSIVTLAPNVDIVVFAPELAEQGSAERLLAVQDYVVAAGLPIVVSGRLEQPICSLVRGHPGRTRFVVRGNDDRYIADDLLDLIAGPVAAHVSREIMSSASLDPRVTSMLVELFLNGVRPFREAADLLGNGVSPFVRRLKDLPRPGQNRIRRLATEQGHDLAATLHHHALLQAVLRYVPGRSYQLGVRLDFRSDDAFRMAVKRGTGVGLRDLYQVDVWPLAEAVVQSARTRVTPPDGPSRKSTGIAPRG